MTQVTTYLDHNASSPLRPGVLEAMQSALAIGGNPSSIHRQGRLARRVVEEARAAVGELVGADASQIVFTSGGTEANHLALQGAIAEYGIERLIISAIEHPSCLEAARACGLPLVEISADANGVVDLAQLESELSGSAMRTLVALMWANNETGVIQPVAEAVEIAKSYGALFMCDAVQGAGKMTIDMDDIGIDFLTMSAHKLGGPQGVGALVLGTGVQVSPLLRGGAQETRRRAGTENVSGIAGFGKTTELVKQELQVPGDLALRRDELERRLCAIAPDVVVFGADAPRLSNTSCFAVPGCKAETLVIALDLAGVAISAGSACSSGKVSRSHVLAGMGVEAKLAEAAIRVSMGWNTTDTDMDRFASAWAEAVGRMTKSSNNNASAGRAAASE